MENCELNDISSQVTVLNGSFPEIEVQKLAYDIAVANIAAKVIMDLSGYISSAVVDGGKLVLSGILESSLDDVEKCYLMHGVRFDKILVDGDWTAVLATKTTPTDI